MNDGWNGLKRGKGDGGRKGDWEMVVMLVMVIVSGGDGTVVMVMVVRW